MKKKSISLSKYKNEIKITQLVSLLSIVRVRVCLCIGRAGVDCVIVCIRVGWCGRVCLGLSDGRVVCIGLGHSNIGRWGADACEIGCYRDLLWSDPCKACTKTYKSMISGMNQSLCITYTYKRRNGRDEEWCCCKSEWKNRRPWPVNHKLLTYWRLISHCLSMWNKFVSRFCHRCCPWWRIFDSPRLPRNWKIKILLLRMTFDIMRFRYICLRLDYCKTN